MWTPGDVWTRRLNTPSVPGGSSAVDSACGRTAAVQCPRSFLFVSLGLFGIEMEMVHIPVHQRSDENRERDKEDDTAVQSVERGKKFPGCRMERIYRTHASEDHRRH